jgi:hypothetical protein
VQLAGYGGQGDEDGRDAALDQNHSETGHRQNAKTLEALRGADGP